MKWQKTIFLYLLIGVGLIAADAWCYLGILGAARDRAASATADAELCQRLARQIMALQAKPAVADTQEQAQDQLSARIESDAHRFGITGDNLASIDPEPAERVADTVYLEKPTVLQLRQVSLEQLINLLCQISGDGSGLRIKALRLSVPPQNQQGNLWSAEVTVTYLIYAPVSQQQNNLEQS